MPPGYSFFVLDDDRLFIELITAALAPIADIIDSSQSSVEALVELLDKKPDCLILDLMMPEMDGLEVLKRLRSDPDMAGMKIVVVTSKTYETDRKQVLAAGADGFFNKPLNMDRFSSDVAAIMNDRLSLGFWGVRGTLPVPGNNSVRYGGNTPCVSLELPSGYMFVFDAGTGIKVLSDHLAGRQTAPNRYAIMISHPHWDHINALPFFSPLFSPGTDVLICGPSHGDSGIYELISGQMDGVYFPVNIKEFTAKMTYRNLAEESFTIETARIQTMLLNHPGYCLGYRVDYRGRSICYLTDNELVPKEMEHYNAHFLNQLTRFLQGADAAIMDATYFPEDYPSKVGWGHSALDQVARLAHEAQVKNLYLFHHDPTQLDDAIERKEVRARAILDELGSSVQCHAPREMQIIQM